MCLYDKSPTLSSLAFSYCTFHLNSWLYSWAHGSRSFMCDQRWSCFRLIWKKMNDLLNTWLNNLWNDFYKSSKVFYFLTAQNSLVPNFSCLLRTEGYLGKGLFRTRGLQYIYFCNLSYIQFIRLMRSKGSLTSPQLKQMPTGGSSRFLKTKWKDPPLATRLGTDPI